MTRMPPPDAAPYSVPMWRLGSAPWQSIPPAGPARARVIVDNDFAGDPDDLPQLVHHLLSPSVEIRAVVASHLRPGDPFDDSDATAAHAETIVRDVFARMGLVSTDVIHRGAELALVDDSTPRPAPAVDAIVAEAMRDDVDSPLFYVAGGGLTDLASALLVEPRIAERLTLVWIGGGEHDGLAVPPPGAMPIEYNLLIDVVAAQVVFANPAVTIWQVPRDAYRRLLVSDAELRTRMATTGLLGRYLYDEIRAVLEMVASSRGGAAETYALGDSPLVLLTALQSVFEPDSTSSRYVTRPTPLITDEGGYRVVDGARPMRVYTDFDLRLTFDDLFAKLAEFDGWQLAGGEARR